MTPQVRSTSLKHPLGNISLICTLERLHYKTPLSCYPYMFTCQVRLYGPSLRRLTPGKESKEKRGTVM